METEKIKIKLSIGGRSYPMTIHPKQEEGLRKAAKNINDMILSLERDYAVRDKQDSLAMTAVTFASQIEQAKLDKNNEDLETKNKLEKIHQIIDVML